MCAGVAAAAEWHALRYPAYRGVDNPRNPHTRRGSIVRHLFERAPRSAAPRFVFRSNVRERIDVHDSGAWSPVKFVERA